MKLAFKWEWHQLQRLFVDQKLEIASVRLREEKKKKKQDLHLEQQTPCYPVDYEMYPLNRLHAGANSPPHPLNHTYIRAHSSANHFE